jgi:hypothetical protein
MRRSRQLAVALLALVVPISAVRGEETPSPLRLIPADTDLLLTVPRPRRTAETLTHLEFLRKLDAFNVYREALASTNFRRFRQFLSYYEKEMDAPWPAILDEIAGGGIAVGIKTGKDQGTVTAVVQGRDEKAVHRFVETAVRLLNEEAARVEDQAKLTKAAYHGIEIVRIGDKLFAATAGTAIVVSNREGALHAALDLHRGTGGKSCADRPGVRDAAKLLPADALATAWFDLDVARRDPNAAAAFKKGPRDDPAQTIIFGGYLDVIGRSPFVAAALVRDKDDFALTIRMPNGRKGMGPDSLLHVPPAGAGCRPLLEPAGTIFSTSFYMDVASIWRDRGKLFPEKVVESFDKADKSTNPILSGLRISKILPQVGTHHRLVVVNQPVTAYKTATGLPVPAFALVSELRQPDEFGKAMDSTLRGAALLAGFKFKLKRAEEKVGDVQLVGFRFDEKQSSSDLDASFLRYYSPCFARVGDQFLWCSTIDLGRELIGKLQTEKKSEAADAVNSRLSAGGVAGYLESIEPVLVTQAVLDQAFTLDEASAEAKAALALMRSLGPLEINVRYDDERFSYEFRLRGLK